MFKLVSAHLSRFHCFESETWSSSSFTMVKNRVNVNHLMPAFCRKKPKKHVHTYSDEMTFTCEVCDAVFNQNDNREQEMRIHSGERPFKCELYKVVVK